jgi:hypothetical protein
MRSIKLRNTLSASAALVALLSLNGCSRFLIENEPPEAKVQLLMADGTPVVDLTKEIPFMGAPIVFTLDGSMSSDDDGTIVKYLWLDSDVPPDMRYDDDLMNLATFTGDPPAIASPQVTLGEGHHQFSLWVTDDEDAISAPATLEFTIKTPTIFMPDPVCAMTYMSAIPECVDCVCTPNAMMGCLDSFTACYQNADPMFVTLCTAVVDCARTMGCTGTACYTAALCMAQIDAAATYNGGALADCQGDPALNPCAASAQLGVCSATGVCMAACTP